MFRPSRWMLTACTAAAMGLGYAATLPHAEARDTEPKTGSKAERAQKPYTFEVYKDNGGEFRWRLRATNKQIIATSGQGYKEKRDCVAGVESVKRHAADAKIEEPTGS